MDEGRGKERVELCSDRCIYSGRRIRKGGIEGASAAQITRRAGAGKGTVNGKSQRKGEKREDGIHRRQYTKIEEHEKHREGSKDTRSEMRRAPTQQQEHM